MKKKPIDCYDLDQIRCSEPGCREDHSIIYLGPTCHAEGVSYVRYEKPSQQLVIECAECRNEIARIALIGLRERVGMQTSMDNLRGLMRKVIADYELPLKEWKAGAKIAEQRKAEGRDDLDALFDAGFDGLADVFDSVEHLQRSAAALEEFLSAAHKLSIQLGEGELEYQS